MSNRKLEIACITLYMSPGHKTILWVENLVTKNRRVYPSLESKRTISLNRMLVYCRLWWPPLGVSQDFFTLSDHHFSLEYYIQVWEKVTEHYCMKDWKAVGRVQFLPYTCWLQKFLWFLFLPLKHSNRDQG